MSPVSAQPLVLREANGLQPQRNRRGYQLVLSPVRLPRCLPELFRPTCVEQRTFSVALNEEALELAMHFYRPSHSLLMANSLAELPPLVPYTWAIFPSSSRATCLAMVLVRLKMVRLQSHRRQGVSCPARLLVL